MTKGVDSYKVVGGGRCFGRSRGEDFGHLSGCSSHPEGTGIPLAVDITIFCSKAGGLAESNDRSGGRIPLLSKRGET